MNKTAIKLYFMFLFIVTLSFAGHTVLVGSQFVAQGAQIAALQKQDKTLTTQTQLLQQQIAQQTAASSISEIAQAEGFQPVTQTISLEAGFVASR